jgi:hypothetical protein
MRDFTPVLLVLLLPITAVAELLLLAVLLRDPGDLQQAHSAHPIAS